jgi:metal-responsive CopG/Arc/MetJ family transcriptional regulator
MRLILRRLAAALPGILAAVAKVMVSLPDELLLAIDREAVRTGVTRSALLRSYAADGMRRRSEDRARVVGELTAQATGHGGDSLERLKALRPAP